MKDRDRLDRDDAFGLHKSLVDKSVLDLFGLD